MFIGRQKELGLLRRELSKKSKAAILIYGRRRIGKSSLISESLKDADACIIRFTAVPDSLEANSARLSAAVAEATGVPGLQITDFEKLLKYISSMKMEVILEIDEYQDLRRNPKGEVVDAYLRDFIDYAPDNIKIIISGSAIRIMKSLLDIDNPLYKRFTLEIPLGEMDYLESSLFYPERSVRDKIALYSVFGGIPMILSMISPEASFEENLMSLLISSNGSARLYAEDILYSELKSSGGAYAAITRIGNGKRSYSEIKASLGTKDANSLDYTLEQLQKADFIEKKNPINETGNRKRIFYNLKSNLLRFHLAYLERNSQAIASAAFMEKYVRPSLNTFISYLFEEIARQWFWHIAEKNIRKDIVAVGTYWYDNPVAKTKGEFDVALETLDGYEIYETKFLQSPMSNALIEEESRKIRSIAGIKITSFGFISSSGFETPGERRIAGDELFSPVLLHL